MRNHTIWVYLLITFAWTWTSWLVGLYKLATGVSPEATNHFVGWFFVGIYGPAVGAILTSLYADGLPGMLALLKKLTLWKASPMIYGIVILGPILVLGIGIALYAWIVGPIGPFEPQAYVVIPNLLLASLVAGPLGEELGWRGFLLPQLQTRFSALQSSLLLGVVWYAWHIPLFFAPFGTLVSGQPLTLIPLALYFCFVLCLSCIYTWVVNQAKGSVLVSILFHLSGNAGLALVFFPGLKEEGKTCYFLATLPLLVLTVSLGLRTGFTNTLDRPLATKNRSFFKATFNEC